jgi:hypothetical protein
MQRASYRFPLYAFYAALMFCRSLPRSWLASPPAGELGKGWNGRIRGKDSACSSFVLALPRVRAQTPQASRKVARRILGKNPTSPMAIAEKKRYFQAPQGLITKPGGISVVHDS